MDTDDNNIWKGIPLSYWIGYAKAGTEFIMHSKLYTTAEARESFINGIYDDNGNNFTRLILKYWTPTVIQ